MDPHSTEEEADDPTDPADPLDALAEASGEVEHKLRPHAGRRHKPDLTRAGRVDRDLPCVDCGYNLRSQNDAGRCPECGTAVAQSLRTDQLYQANTAWLGKLARGMQWLVTGVAAYILLTVAIVAAFSLFGQAIARTDHGATIVSALAYLIAAAYCLSFGYAILQVTSPEPAALVSSRLRVVSRWPLITTFAIWLGTATLQLAPRTVLPLTTAILGFAAAILFIIGFVAFMLYLRQLAKRMPDHGLVKQTTTVMVGLAVSLFCSIGGVAATDFLDETLRAIIGNKPDPANVILTLFVCPGILGVLVFGLWWIVLMQFYSLQFVKTQRLAFQRARRTDRAANQS
ncbi:MAG: hypothetical protein ACPGYV_06610 [Phycisphaeraceae bacterium]